MAVTISVGASVTYADTTAGCTGTSGKYWLRARIAGAQYAKQEVVAPGVDGAAINRMGFRHRSIEQIDVIYVANSVAAAAAAANTDHDAMVNKKLTVTIHGIGLQNTELEEFRWVKGPKPTSQNGMYRLHCQLRFDQKRPN